MKQTRPTEVASRAAMLGLKILVVAVFFELLLIPLAGVGGWVGLAVATVLAVTAIAFPWRRFWRREFGEGGTLRHAHTSRSALALIIVAGGIGVCIASDYWFGAHSSIGVIDGERFDSGPLIGVMGDVIVSAPFLLISILLLVTAFSRTAATIAAIGLAGLCIFVYWAVASSDSSTASLAFIAPWFWGILGIAVIYAADAIARRAADRRRVAQAREM